LDIKDIERLLKLIKENGIEEIEITLASGESIKVIAKRAISASNTIQTIQQPHHIPTVEDFKHEAVKAPIQEEKEDEGLIAIKSPIVGTFYRAPSPDAEPYIKVGDIVEKGQIVCIVEAMKTFNEIESEVKGKIVKILVENEQPVEFGQELFLVKPM